MSDGPRQAALGAAATAANAAAGEARVAAWGALLLQRLSEAAGLLGAAVALAVGFMTLASVIGRAFFASPIPGDVELTQLGIALAVSLGLPWCQWRKANIIVDFFTQHFSASQQHRLDAFGALLLALMCGLLSWRAFAGALAVREAHETTMILSLPMWWAYASLAPGLALTALIALWQAWQHAAGRLRPGLPV